MRVMHLIPDLEVAGAQRALVDLVGGLAARGVTVGVVAQDGPLTRELPEGAVRIPVIDRGRSVTGSALAVAGFARAIRRFEPDLLHAHNARMTGLAAVARLSFSVPTRLPLVATCQGYNPYDVRRSARIYSAADALVCVSEDLKGPLLRLGCSPRLLTVIPNAVAIQQTRAHREAILRRLELANPPVAIVGRLVTQKAHWRFLEAARIIVGHLPETRFVVLGDGPLRERLAHQARQLGLNAHVMWLGVRSDVREIVSASALLLFTSEWEGLSLAALEAMAAGVPIVSTRAEGMRELLCDGAGLLVDSAQYEIAEAVIELLRDPHRRSAMGKLGQRRVATHYSLERSLLSYVRLYESVLEATGRVAAAPRPYCGSAGEAGDSDRVASA